MTSTLWHAVMRTVFLATRASTRSRSPTGRMTFKGLRQDRFGDEYERGDGQRMGEQQRDGSIVRASLLLRQGLRDGPFRRRSRRAGEAASAE